MHNAISKFFRCLAAGALLLMSANLLAQITDINAAINKAGRQRMLSQRIAKAYFQIGQGIDVQKSRQVLDASVAAFDRQLVELKNYAPTPEIKTTYQQLEKLWLDYKDALLGAAPSKTGGQKVLALSDDVLKLANQGTFQLEKYSGTTGGRLVNLAGRQRMLSQRMAKFYLAQNWDLGGKGATAELDKARKEFVATHAELTTAAEGNQALKDVLGLVGQQWVFFDIALAKQGGDRATQSRDVAVSSELILQEMENAVSLFERTGK